MPFRLDEGLFFEDQQILIRWGSALDVAALPAAPELICDDDTRLVIWRSRVALGGLRGDASAAWFKGKYGSSVFPSNLPVIHRTWFNTSPSRTADEAPRTVEQVRKTSRLALEALYGHLERVLGPAAWSYPGYCLDLPSIGWAPIACQGALFHVGCTPDSYGEAFRIEVEHWANDYPDLQAEAELAHERWARTDARVPFIAWDLNDERIPKNLKAWRLGWFQRQLEVLESQLRTGG